MKLAAGFAFALVGSLALQAGTSLNDPAIVTDSGPLKGIVTAQTNAYLGIPYAAPPVGALRWMPPQAFGQWHGVLDATGFGSECPQKDNAGDDVGDENCLFLNVYTPHIRKSDHDRLPVMVWIHGGGLTAGNSADFDPSPLLSAGGIIVVTVNYRLGVLGFLAHPAIDGEGHLAGNYGFLDQQFALEWVQRNIRVFGGDPGRVTIFGESAGGLSIYSQIASPLAAGLFEGAIAQSGAYAGFAGYHPTILPIATAETISPQANVRSGVDLAAAAGCPDQSADCLRTLDATALVDAQRSIYPFIDGAVLAATPGAAFASGRFNQVPVMTGTNHDEYRYFVAREYHSSLTNADYPAATNALFGPAIGAAVLAQYPVALTDPVDAASLALGAAGTDGVFACTARRAMRSLSQFVTTYAYEFNDEHAPSPEFQHLNFPLGAFHSADVQYLFNRSGVAAPFTPAQQQLSQAMAGYWTQFAKSGDPNAAGQPVWSPYDPATDLRQSFVPPTPTVESGFAVDHRCGFWDHF